jgi:hypothetical protein
MKKYGFLILILFIFLLGIFAFYRRGIFSKVKFDALSNKTNNTRPENINSSPLQISQMRKADYPGSGVTIEKTLSSEDSYKQYIASYKSDGLKIYALLTVPVGDPPKGGWPMIIFNHGYIPPEQYRTTERYVAYVDGFARNGFAVSKDIKAAVIWSGVVGTYEELLNKWKRTVPFTPSRREIASRGASVRKNLFDKYGTPEQNPDFWHSIDPRYNLNYLTAPC